MASANCFSTLHLFTLISYTLLLECKINIYWTFSFPGMVSSSLVFSSAFSSSSSFSLSVLSTCPFVLNLHCSLMKDTISFSVIKMVTMTTSRQTPPMPMCVSLWDQLLIFLQYFSCNKMDEDKKNYNFYHIMLLLWQLVGSHPNPEGYMFISLWDQLLIFLQISAVMNGWIQNVSNYKVWDKWSYMYMLSVLVSYMV